MLSESSSKRHDVPTDGIPVVYGVDNRFALPLAASIESALDHLGPDERLDIHIVDGGLSERNRSRLQRSFTGRPCRLTFVSPGRGTVDSLKVGGAITVATYYRLLIPRILPDHANAIYLDADVIVQADLRALWDTPLDDYYLLAVQDQGVRVISGPFGLPNYKSLGVPEGTKYFNAGVLVLNLEKWRQEHVAETIVDYVSQHPQHIRFHDQDGLNAILWRHWRPLDPRWNQMAQILRLRTADESPFDPLTFEHVRGNPYIIHYSSADKPWRAGCRHPARGLFFRYVDRTAYRGFRPSRWRTRAGDSRDFVLRRLRRLFSVVRRGRG